MIQRHAVPTQKRSEFVLGGLVALQPRLRQVVESIRNDIVAGLLPEHAVLPSGRVVADRFGVSRMTARRALEAIEAQGLACSEDRKGRFVSPGRVRYDITNRVSFAAEAGALGKDLEITVVRQWSVGAESASAANLGIPVGEKLHTYTRLFCIRGHPILIETECVIARRCPDMLDHDLRQSTTLLPERHYGISARTGDVPIRMRAVTGKRRRSWVCSRIRRASSWSRRSGTMAAGLSAWAARSGAANWPSFPHRR